MKFEEFEKLLMPTQPVNIAIGDYLNFNADAIYNGVYADMGERLDAFTMKYILASYVLGIETHYCDETLYIVISSQRK